MPEPSTIEIKETVDNLAGLFETFKAKNDERWADIAKRGSADPLDEATVNRMNTEITAIQTKAAALDAERKAAAEAKVKAEVDAEKREAALHGRIDGLEVALKRTGAGGSDDDKIEVKHAVSFWSEQKKRVIDPAEVDLDGYKAYCAAFRTYMRRSNDKYGQDLDPEERKALSVGIEADGGYWVIPAVADRVLTRLFETSPMRSIANVITIGTDAIEFPTDTNDATSGGWVGEQGARAETATPQTGMQRIPVHEQYANPRSTQKLLDDSSFDAEGWLGAKIADKLSRDENIAFVTGNGVDRPKGFLDYSSAATTGAAAADSSRAWGVLEYVFTGASAAFDTGTVDATAGPADELVDLMGKLNPAYRPAARWAMNRATEADVRKLRTTTSEYVVTLNVGNITGTPLGSFNLFGFPIINFEDMPDQAADSFSIAFGDFGQGYQIVDRQGIRTLRDPFSAKPFVQFYTTKRVGGDVVNFDSIKLLKFGTS